MMSDPELNEQDEMTAEEPEIDPAQLNYALQQLREEENFPLAILTGSVAAALGGGIWWGHHRY